MSLTKATVFRAKPEVQTFEQLIRTEDRQGHALPALKAIQLPAEIDFGANTTVEIRAAFKPQEGKQKNENDIPWLSFLNTGLAAANRFKFEFKNSHPSAVVAVKIERQGEIKLFALTFGLGAEAFLYQESLMRDFGIRVAMNICDEEKLKRVRTSIHEAISTQAERQISTGSPFRVFGIDDEREFLRSVSGTVSEAIPYIRSITGRDSVNVSFDPENVVNWHNIVPRLEELDNASRLDRYRSVFHGYDRFAIENDREIIQQLDAIIFNQIKEGELQHIHLAPPEFVDFDSKEFSYSSEPEAPRFDDITIDDLIKQRRRFTDRSSIDSIRSMRVYMWDIETGIRVKNWSAYRCLVAEAQLNARTFILSMGIWRRVSDNLLQEVKDYLENNIALASDPFLLSGISIWDPNAREDADGNPVGENRESVYNESVADAAIGDLVLFDRAKIEIAGEKIYEVCDLLHRQRALIHVKRLRSGAASVTHLFLQGRFYGDAFLADQATRTAMRKFVVDKLGTGDAAPFLDAIPEKREDLVSNNFRIVFCLLTHIENADLNVLPFMAQYELMHTHKHLYLALGFQCEVAIRQIQLGP